jgi:hypothetical protein
MSNDNVQDTSNSEPVALTIDDAAEAILGNWEDADKEDQPSEDALEATEETTEETDVEDSDTEEGEETEEEA